MLTLTERAKKLEEEGVFLGGPAELFEIAGQKLLATLLNEGLTSSSKVLDIGCGCLRGGYRLIHFLGKGSYYGIEPNVNMLESGIRLLLEPGIIDQKLPRFNHNSNFDFTVFDEKFDVFVARSIWTHASKQQIQTMLDGFVSTAHKEGVFITSYVPSPSSVQDYMGAEWVGISHESDTPGIVCHSLDWIKEECAKRGLIANEIDEDKAHNFGNQVWLRIKHKDT